MVLIETFLAFQIWSLYVRGTNVKATENHMKQIQGSQVTASLAKNTSHNVITLPLVHLARVPNSHFRLGFIELFSFSKEMYMLL